MHTPTQTTAETAEAPPPRDLRRWWPLALLGAAQFMLIIDVTVVNVALPSIGRDLGLDRAAMTWVAIAYTLLFGSLLLLGGRLADTFGRRRTFLAGLSLFTAASAASGLAADGNVLIISRAFQGVGAALMSPAALSIITTTFKGPDRNRALGVWAALGGGGAANKVGTWAFNFRASRHGTNRGAIFGGKTVPARFGAPWTTKTYSASVPIPGRYDLVIPPRVTGSTNGIQDGYDVIAHLANLPFTQEYISVKLCRLFVHDDFPNPTTTTNLPEYAFYDYTNPNLSPEAKLVHDCMLAWENSSPKGNIRAVLSTIFNSDLFRSHTAVAQKVKTPLEFVASSVRALRSVNASGTATANTDGYSFNTRLNNMGSMALFDRAEPDGYPEVGPSWISAGTLVERIRYIQAFCNSGTGDDAGNHVCDPVALLKKKLPSGSWDNAGAVADYFLAILYPGEGTGNLSLYRQAAINYLNTADNGTTVSTFNTLGNTSTTYDTRVRGMVSMLMTFQRFQEQ